RALRGQERDHSLTAGELADLSGRVFEELQRVSERHGAALVLLYLPTFADYDSPGDLWRARIAREAHRRDIPWIDLVEEQRALPRADAVRLYEAIDAGAAHSSDTPYSEAGHAWVAEAIRSHLHQLPRVEAMLAASRT